MTLNADLERLPFDWRVISADPQSVSFGLRPNDRYDSPINRSTPALQGMRDETARPWAFASEVLITMLPEKSWAQKFAKWESFIEKMRAI